MWNLLQWLHQHLLPLPLRELIWILQAWLFTWMLYCNTLFHLVFCNSSESVVFVWALWPSFHTSTHIQKEHLVTCTHNFDDVIIMHHSSKRRDAMGTFVIGQIPSCRMGNSLSKIPTHFLLAENPGVTRSLKGKLWGPCMLPYCWIFFSATT